jgi:hypothetical protein
MRRQWKKELIVFFAFYAILGPFMNKIYRCTGALSMNSSKIGPKTTG